MTLTRRRDTVIVDLFRAGVSMTTLAWAFRLTVMQIERRIRRAMPDHGRKETKG